MSWDVKSRKYIFKNKFIGLMEKETIHPKMGSHDFYTIDFPDWVNVVAITKENQLILVKQYRHGIEDFSLEVPGGVVDQGEKPMSTAERELLEETGYRGNMVSLGKVLANPAIQNNYCHLFLCMDCEKASEQNLDNTEEIELQLIPFEKVEEQVFSHKIIHSLSVVSLLKAKFYLQLSSNAI